jgi:hypothetical protein
VSFLVVFVADPAEDVHADALRELARSVPGAGFFDDPDGGDERTVGAFARVDALADELAQALIGHVGRLSAELEVRIEVQYEERILGHLVAGQADAALLAALKE